ncbi:hypothetical protein [Zavarzinella formosa]|uniref:hypothetical protein n=1 Tax=Zavarzinella formosa TaxID=360055 RepID=UPI0002D377BB|nr:hypothetical protein [Zavarzinella formosa]
MNQADLRRLTDERIKDAHALLAGGRWEFAYYCAGYAIECALKSSLLARMIHTGWVFEEKWRAEECMTHEPFRLVKLAGLEDEFNDRLKASSLSGDQFIAHWSVVKEWKVTSRYEAKTEAEARSLLEAITNSPDGVLPWIQKYW